jgi:Flp pilus assembly protein TadG
MALNMIRTSRIVYRGRRFVAGFAGDKRGVAAVEFAFIVPLMLLLLFGVIDTSSGVAIDRKVTLTARTLSDLVSQGSQVTSTDISNFFKMGTAVMAPYAVTPTTMTQRITQVTIDATKTVKVVWSYKGTISGSSVTVTAGYSKDTVITTIPTDLLVPNTHLIWSEVTYTYKPITGYVMKTSIPLSEQTYTRPRQSEKVDYTS